MAFDIATLKQSISLIDLIMPDTSLSGGPAEYYGACPRCGGTDRFHFNRDKGWFCAYCTGRPGDGKGHWHDAIDYIMWRDNLDFAAAFSRLGGNTSISGDDYRIMQQERRARDEQRRAVEREQQSARQVELDQSKAWITYYESMDEYSRALWHKRGLSDLWIDYFQVGYDPAHTFYHKGKPFTSPSLTIPTLRPVMDTANQQGRHLSWRCIGLAHRLLLDNAPGGKYRPHISGAGKSLFPADLYAPLLGDVLLVEGEIKAMVTWAHVQQGQAGKCTSPLGNLQVAGMPGKSFKTEWVDEFANASRIWICLDPDATIEAETTARLLGPERCRIIDLPGKIDDLLVDEIMDVFDLAELIRAARRVR